MIMEKNKQTKKHHIISNNNTAKLKKKGKKTIKQSSNESAGSEEALAVLSEPLEKIICETAILQNSIQGHFLRGGRRCR